MSAFENRKLLDACKIGNLLGAREALSGGADVNCSGETNERPLHYAVASGVKDLVDLLLQNGANVNLVDSSYNTAIELTRDARILRLLLQARKPIADGDYFDRLLYTCCSSYKHELGSGEENRRLIAYFASKLSCTNVFDLLKDKNVMKKYIAHLLSFKIEGMREGWAHQEYLALRIHIYLQLLVELYLDIFPDSDLPVMTIEADSATAGATSVGDKTQLFNLMKVELLNDIEMIRVIKDRKAAKKYKLTSAAELFADRTLEQVWQQPPSVNCSFYAGHAKHALYANFIRQTTDTAIVVIDNLGEGVRFHQIDPISGNYYPYVIGPLDRVTFRRYLLDIYSLGLESSALGAQRIIYNATFRNEELEKTFPAMPEQKVGNCVVYNLMPRTLRLPKDIGTFCLNYEQKLCVDEKRYAVDVRSPLPFLDLKTAQEEKKDEILSPMKKLEAELRKEKGKYTRETARLLGRLGQATQQHKGLQVKISALQKSTVLLNKTKCQQLEQLRSQLREQKMAQNRLQAELDNIKKQEDQRISREIRVKKQQDAARALLATSTDVGTLAMAKDLLNKFNLFEASWVIYKAPKLDRDVVRGYAKNTPQNRKFGKKLSQLFKKGDCKHKPSAAPNCFVFEINACNLEVLQELLPFLYEELKSREVDVARDSDAAVLMR